MADNKIEILTSNAKQVINDYVLGTDTDFQKVENAIQELAESTSMFAFELVSANVDGKTSPWG